MTGLDILRRSGRNLRAAKLRTLLTALALGVGGFTLSVTLAASQGARDYTQRLVRSNFDPTVLMVAKDSSMFDFGSSQSNGPKEYDPSLVSLGGGNAQFLVKRLSDTDLAKISRLPGVAGVHVQYNITPQYVTREGAKRYTATIADSATAPKPATVAGHIPAALADTDILLPQDYLTPLKFATPGAAIGKPVYIRLMQPTGMSELKTFRIAAVVRPPAANASLRSPSLIVSPAAAAGLNQFMTSGTTAQNQYLNVTVNVEHGDDPAALARTKAAIEQAGYAARTAAEAQDFLNQIINVLQIIILVFGAITLIASFFGVVNTQYISVLERTREIGLMKALGMRRATVAWLFVVEATWIGLLGALLGSGVAVVAGTLLNPWISRLINFGSDRLLVFKPLQLLGLVVFLMAITTIAGLLPALKAAKLDPIEALRSE